MHILLSEPEVRGEAMIKASSTVHYGRYLLVIVLLSLANFGEGCKKREDRVIVRILLPPSSSPLEKAIINLESNPLQTDGGRTIVPARMVTKDDREYREFLQQAQTFRPQVVIVPTAADIPAPLQAETRYTTLPCSNSPNPCVAVVTPWATNNERRAADRVLRHLSPDRNVQ